MFRGGNIRAPLLDVPRPDPIGTTVASRAALTMPLPALALVVPAAVAFLATAFATSVHAQCTQAWLPGYGCPGASGGLTASTSWDPDGAGPAPSVVVIGGGFSVVGTVAAESLAVWQPSTGVWSTLPSPPMIASGPMVVTALATLASGELVVVYRNVSQATSRVATWNGTTWTVLGADFVAEVTSLLERPNGELVAGGDFASVGGLPGGHVARWTGGAWQAVGGGVDGTVRALANGAAGELLVGGAFDHAGGVAASGVAQWNGTTWSPVGSFSGYAWSLTAGSGRVFAGTDFGLRQWDGVAWTTVPGLAATPFPFPSAFFVKALPSGRVVVGGYIASAGGVPTRNIAAYDPAAATWSVFGSGIANYGTTLTNTVTELANGELLVGGYFTDAGGTPALHVAHWTGSQWSALGQGLHTPPDCVEVTGPDRFVVGGRSLFLPNGLALWNGSSWAPIGGGVAGANAHVMDLMRLPGGDLLAGGSFAQAGGLPANSLARWDGTAWSEFAGGVTWFGNPGAVTEILRRANGDLVVVGTFDQAGGVPCANLAVWNGSAWSSLGLAAASAISDVAESSTGELFVATQTGGAASVQRLDGTGWTVVHVAGNGESIADLAVLDDGGLAIAGDLSLFGGTNRKAYLDLVTPSGTVRHQSNDFRSGAAVLHRLPGGDLLVGGTFRTLGTVVCDGLARLTGGSFGTLVPMVAGPGAADIATFPNGDLLLGGGVTSPGTSVYLVGRLAPTCPALAASTAAGCAGSGGPNVLAPVTLPWIGEALESQATGMPALGVAIGIRGFGTTSIPLSSVLPLGVPGCALLVSDDILELHMPVAGAVRTSIAIPYDASLAGLVVHEQVAVFEANTAGAFTALTATNRLSHTIGVF